MNKRYELNTCLWYYFYFISRISKNTYKSNKYAASACVLQRRRKKTRNVSNICVFMAHRKRPKIFVLYLIHSSTTQLSNTTKLSASPLTLHLLFMKSSINLCKVVLQSYSLPQVRRHLRKRSNLNHEEIQGLRMVNR